jgi:hypothetical protein
MDLSGGMPPLRDTVLAEAPEDPLCREGENMWIFDDQGRFTLPRIGVEAIASQWMDRGLQGNIGFPNGRALNGAGPAPGRSPLAVDGEARVFAAGPCELESREPFRRWRFAWHGPMRDTNIDEQLAGIISDKLVQVHVEVETTMAVPPWVQGEMSEEAAALLRDGIEGTFMGGVRHEQLFRCEGSFRVSDGPMLDFSGTGLRIHRIGRRDVGEFWGHNWQSAVFPSGRAFGFITFPPRPDGSPSYSEGYVFDGNIMHPARIVEVQWLTKIEPSGGDVSVVLETKAHGELRIAGSTHGSTFSVQGGSLHLDWKVDGQLINPCTFHQGGAHYTWEGEESYGMVERSLPEEQIITQ